MNWTALSAMADILASIGVIISLVYLAVQVKQSAAVIKLAGFEKMFDKLTDQTSLIVENEDVASIYLRGQESYNSLSETEQIRFHMYMSGMMQSLNIIFTQSTRDLIDPVVFKHTADIYFEKVLTPPGVREWWSTWKTWYQPEFVTYVDANVSQKNA